MNRHINFFAILTISSLVPTSGATVCRPLYSPRAYARGERVSSIDDISDERFNYLCDSNLCNTSPGSDRKWILDGIGPCLAIFDSTKVDEKEDIEDMVEQNEHVAPLLAFKIMLEGETGENESTKGKEELDDISFIDESEKIEELLSGEVSSDRNNKKPHGEDGDNKETTASAISRKMQVTTAPTSIPTTATSTSLPTSLKPTSNPTMSTPTESPMTSNPSKSPTTSTPTTSKPTSNPTTSTPSKSPTTSNPSASKPSSSPTTATPLTTTTPTTSKLSASPTATPTTSTPTTAKPVKTKRPTRQPTSSPSLKPKPTSSPTTGFPTYFPTTSVSPTTKKPTTSVPTTKPTTSAPLEPTSSPTKRAPCTFCPEGVTFPNLVIPGTVSNGRTCAQAAALAAMLELEGLRRRS